MTGKLKLGLLGNGIGRSRSPFLHELIGRAYGLEVTYLPIDLSAQQQVNIEDELQRCQQQGFNGVNVTHPYKRAAFQYVTPMAGFPQGLTSVNTVLFDGNMMRANNTDFSGFCHAYRDQFGGGSNPGRVLMLGTGGVGLAIAFGLMQLNASELVVYDTEVERAQELISNLKGATIPVRQAGDSLVDEMLQADGLINATPVGMYQYPGNPFPLEGFSLQRWAFDAVYTPENTEFLQQCKQHDIETLSGFKLFLYQGVDAFQYFSGISVDANRVETLFLQQYPLETLAS